MKDYERLLITTTNEYVDDYGVEGLLDELFPGMSAGELVLQMYDAGILPEDVLEKFLSE